MSKLDHTDRTPLPQVLFRCQHALRFCPILYHLLQPGWIGMVVLCLSCFHAIRAQVVHQIVNETLIGPGALALDINSDGTDDYLFDIILLSVDELAARVHPQGAAQILDNSTFGYPDALEAEDWIAGYFHSNVGVLGTFHEAGQFKGKGIRYLGINVQQTGASLGWIALRCSEARDTLTILSFAFSTDETDTFQAGQTEGITDMLPDPVSPVFGIYPNPVGNTGWITGSGETACHVAIYSYTWQLIDSDICRETMDFSALPPGIYHIRLQSISGRRPHTFTIVHE